MGWNFRKSKSFGAFRVTLSKSGVSYSVGKKGLRYTKRANGKQQITASLPGTGISYTETIGQSSKPNRSSVSKKRVPRTYQPDSTYGEFSTSEQILDLIEDFQQQRKGVESFAKFFLIGGIIASPVLIIISLVPILNGIAGVLFSLPLLWMYNRYQSIDAQLLELESQLIEMRAIEQQHQQQAYSQDSPERPSRIFENSDFENDIPKTRKREIL